MGIDRPIDITADQRKTLLALLERHLPNTEAWVYGSRVKWTSRPQSDLDLVVFATPEQDRRVSDLREAFEESSLPFRVDLFVWDDVPEQFRKQIEAEHVVLAENKEQGVAGEWVQTSLADLIDIRHGFAFKGAFIHEEECGDVLLTPGNFAIGGGFKDDKFKYYDGSPPEEFILSNGDLLVTMTDLSKQTDTLGYPAFVSTYPEGRRYLHNQRLGKVVIKDKLSLNVRYLYYVMCSAEYRHEVLASATGTTVRHTSPERIKRFRFLLPPLPEQRAIAHVLGTLDDKIELNRRMNETLEAMARALFKSWFVDFDPVRAKAALKRHAAAHSSLEGESAKARSTDAAPSDTTPLPIGSRPRPPSNATPSITPPLRGSRQGKDEVRSRAGGGTNRWGEIKRRYTQQTLQNAKTLRCNQTNAESLLWHCLRDKQLDGHKFRRQQPIGPYIVDFACISQKLLIELDGGGHAERKAHDREREEFLRQRGYRVLRFWNNEVFENCFGVLESIYAALTHHPPLEGGSKDDSLSGRGFPPPHQPSPHGSASASPPPGGSDWTVERARAYLDGMGEEIAALFPDSFVDSELGEIPEGWEVKALGKCFDLTMGQSPPGSTYNEHGEGLPFFQGRSDFGFRYPENRKFCTAPTRIAQPADTLVSVRAPVGDINMAWERCCIGRGVAALRHKLDTIPFTYYSAWRIQGRLREYEHTGTVFGAINKSQFEALRVIEPDPSIVNVFDSCARPLDARIRSSITESRTLAALRDTLLPKLVSGEVRVGN